MNRKNLTAAVLAGLAGVAGIASTAQAVNLNPDGLGQVLIYPYYTVNGGNLTTLSVVNTSEDAKAVKVRFLESQNSLEVLDFNLYLSAYDVWVAAVVNAGGTPTLIVEDETCTVPDLLRDFGGSQAFLTFGLSDGGPTDISRTREGHFEMIEMGKLVGQSAVAATHSAGGVPPDTNYLATTARPCGRLVDAWSYGDDNVPGSPDDGYWLYDGAPEPELNDIEDPVGGLFGGAAIVNPQAGTMYSYDARAINGYSDSRGGGQNLNLPLHSEPGDGSPSLNDGDQMTGYVFTNFGGVNSGTFQAPVDAVSYVFMHDTVMNEYLTGGALAAQSEWVLTFPTKNEYVNSNPAKDPFIESWGQNAVTGRWEACEPVLLDTVWDQEERTTTIDTPDEICPPVVSPAPPVECGEPVSPFALCFETNVIRFGDAVIPDSTELLGSTTFTNIDLDALGFSAGWARIDMMQYAGTNAGGVFDGSRETRDPLAGGYDPDGTQLDGNEIWGLPVTGFWVVEANNGYLTDGAGNNVLANYGGLYNHKATRCFAGVECRDLQISAD